jgi:Tfp pilus assembly protein FimT
MLQTPVRGVRRVLLVELMIVVAFAGTLMAVSVPILRDISETSKLNEAVRTVERELQGARLRAVNVNRPLRCA